MSKSIIAYIAINGKNSFFTDSVSMGKVPHMAEYISASIKHVFESAHCNIAGAVTDNTTVNKKTWGILKGLYPEFFSWL